MREITKHLANGLAVISVLPAVLAYRISSMVLGRQRAFPGWSQGLSLLPGLCGEYVRRAFYRMALTRCGEGTVISFGSVFSHPTAELGADAYVGVFCCLGDVTLEDDVLIGSHVSIMNGSAQHGLERLDVPVREQAGKWP